MGFDDFLGLFKLKQTADFAPTDIKNAFRLLSREYVRENKISLQRIEEILAEQNLNEQEIQYLTKQFREKEKVEKTSDGEYFIDFDELVNNAFQ